MSLSSRMMFYNNNTMIASVFINCVDGLMKDDCQH